MSTYLEAVYENGVFRPLQPVQLPEHQRVSLTINEASAVDPATIQAHFELPADRWQAFCDALDAPPKHLPNLKKLFTDASLFEGNGTRAH